MTRSILFFTDTHLAAEPIGQRLGNYGRDMLDKIAWVVQQAAGHDLVAFGGDLVNAPGVSLRIVNGAVSMLRTIPHLVLVWGQHDLVGHNPKTILQSAASVAYWALPNHPGVSERREMRCAGLSTRLISHSSYLEAHLQGGEYPTQVDVAVVHALLGFNIPLAAVELNAAIVLSGDYHDGYEPQRVRDTWFFNPGALSRKTIDDYDRIPRVASIRYDPERKVVEGREYLPVPCRPAAAVFDLGKHLARQDGEARHSEYIKMLGKATVTPQMPVDRMLEEMGLEQPVREYVSGKLAEAEQREK